jgi:formylglycine-generating enzyme required for sulfatase activity
MLRRISFAWFACFLLCVAVLLAAPEKPVGKAYAFLLACGESDSGQLQRIPSASTDLTELRDALVAFGYGAENVVLLCDDSKDRRRLPLRAKILRELEVLLGRIGPEDTLLVGYYGHAVKFRDEAGGYWCPRDAHLEARKTLLPTIGKDGIFERLRGCKARRKLLLVDASRKSVVLAAKGIELEDRDEDVIPAGISAIYSCKPGQTSHRYDPANPACEGRHGSLFFQHVINAWYWPESPRRDELTLGDLRYAVQWATAGAARRLFDERQTPVVRREEKGDAEWVLRRMSEQIPPPEKIAVFEYEVDGKKDLGHGRVVTVLLGDGITMEFVRIPAGRFEMGAGPPFPLGIPEPIRLSAEITEDFFLGRYEVTQEQYEKVMGKNPSAFSATGASARAVRGLNTKRFPVESVSWEDASRFCRRMTVSIAPKGLKFRLPTEAEWEYACRAGSKDWFCFGNDVDRLEEFAWFMSNSSHRTHEVGVWKPNRFGLYDMHGNVDEWCADWDGPPTGLNPKNPVRLENPAGGSKHIYRGGGWTASPRQCAASHRDSLEMDTTLHDQGFRVAFSAR